MMIKKVGLAVSFVALMGLQGCGGGGESTTSSTSTSGTVASASNASTTTGGTTTGHVVGSSQGTTVSKTSTRLVYILKEKLEVFADYNATTVYGYKDAYVAESNTTRTDGVHIDKSYDYNATSKVLNVKVKNAVNSMELTQKVTFKDATVYSKPEDMMSNANAVYLYNTFDPIHYFGKKRVVENITDIDKGLNNVKKYSYNSTGVLDTLTVGYADDNSSDATYEYSYTKDESEVVVTIKDEAGTERTMTVNASRYTYSPDNKIVTETADDKVLRIYTFENINN